MINKTVLRKISHLLKDGEFGLEKENLRVDMDGKLALSPHPQIFGDKSENPYITTDFSESQVELITPCLSSIEEMYDFAHTLNDIVLNEIGDELLWPQSLPPILPNEDDIPIAKYHGKSKELEEYRNTISRVYGKHRQLISGIHFNISFTEKLFIELQKELGKDISDIKEYVYLKITRGLMRHRWLLIWMFGKTPVAEPNFKVRSLTNDKELPMQCESGISLRSGPMGYRNREDYILDFSSIDKYNKSVEKLIEEGHISSIKELYLPIRMKFHSKDNGKPSYLEVRFLDLDPLSPIGIDKDALYAVYLLFIYSLISEESIEFDKEEQIKATLRQDIAACHGRNSDAKFHKDIAEGASIAEEALSLVFKVKNLLTEFGIMDNPSYISTISKMEKMAKDPSKRWGVKLYNQSKDQGFVDYHLSLAKQYKELAIQNGYRFWGYEDMEMSTQLLMRAALCKGINLEILDRSENFIRLNKDNNNQLVVQATKTSIDNYATVLAMENKVVTKKLLSEQGIMVPEGGEYFTKQNAINDFEIYKNKAIVIKPKSTNFGIGITILKENEDISNFETALDIAFEHDNCVLIEKFIEGREFRIFVIGEEVVGILHRVPANVKGDGIHTIRQLIEIKNQDTRRGKGYRTPLEKISMGKEEELFLELQGATFDTIVKEGETMYLRENSNISTGGDSIDFTDEVDSSYKDIAIKAAKVVGANITGVDMMIQDINSLANSENHSIIEINFNPAIHIHCYPYKGKNRQLNFKILKALGF